MIHINATYKLSRGTVELEYYFSNFIADSWFFIAESIFSLS